MPLFTDAALTWSAPVSLSSGEIWQTQKGSVFLSTSAAPGHGDGLAVPESHVVQFAAGVTEVGIAREAT